MKHSLRSSKVTCDCLTKRRWNWLSYFSTGKAANFAFVLYIVTDLDPEWKPSSWYPRHKVVPVHTRTWWYDRSIAREVNNVIHMQCHIQAGRVRAVHYYYLEFARTVRTSRARDCFKQTNYQTRQGAPGSASTPKHDPTFRQTDQKACTDFYSLCKASFAFLASLRFVIFSPLN